MQFRRCDLRLTLGLGLWWSVLAFGVFVSLSSLESQLPGAADFRLYPQAVVLGVDLRSAVLEAPHADLAPS